MYRTVNGEGGVSGVLSLQATALDVGGHHVFVTRFVKAQNPPAELTPPQGHSLTLPDMVSSQ